MADVVAEFVASREALGKTFRSLKDGNGIVQRALDNRWLQEQGVGLEVTMDRTALRGAESEVRSRRR